MIKRIILTVFIFVLTAVDLCAQTTVDDYAVMPVHKKIGEVVLAPQDNGTPLEAFVAYSKAFANRNSAEMNRLTSVSRQLPLTSRTDAPDQEFDQTEIEKTWGRTIDKIVIYKDSVAGVIVTFDGGYSIRWMLKEKGQWVNYGEGLGGDTPEASEVIFKRHVPEHLKIAERIESVQTVSSDTAAFTAYLQAHGRSPGEFMLEVLAKHRLVIYGEIHFRKASWDLIRSVAASPEFSQSTGTVFLELSSHSQNDLDCFFDNETKQPEIILKVLRESYLTGWNDKGMYEFLLDLWEINRMLPPEKRIKVIAPEIPRPFSLPTGTSEEYKSYTIDLPPLRDEYMADAIGQYLDSATDKRNSLFIVGCAHANKSPENFTRNGKTVGRRLSERFPDEDVFSILPHSPVISNRGGVYGLVRNGLFDYVFAENGDIPIAFDLPDSPFGKEPFDASFDECYRPKMGAYEDCYDGYIFFGPLKTEEPLSYQMEEFYGDGFLDEIRRRAVIAGIESRTLLGTQELELDQILLKMRQRSNSKRWSEIENETKTKPK